MRTPAAVLALLTLSLALASGCARSRTFTIYSKPADARLVINGVERGPGPITQSFNFGGSSGAVRVSAVREGYRATPERLTANYPHDTVVIEMEALGPKAVVSIEPAAMVWVNGVLVRPTPVRVAEITLDPTTPDKVYTVTAEQTGYAREVRTITSSDPQGYYRIQLKPLRPNDGAMAVVPRPDRVTQSRPVAPGPATRQAPGSRGAAVAPRPPVVSPPVRSPVPAPLKRDIVIRTEPAAAGAEIYIGGEKWGDREVRLAGHEFKRDAAGKSVPQPISAVAPGFEGGQAVMRWEDNKPVYVIPLGRRRKDVRITTDPPGATVTLNGKPLPKDRSGVSSGTVYFPPVDPPQGPTPLTATVTPADPAAGFEPGQLAIGWDDGRKDYSVRLEPSRYVKVPMLQVVPAWDAGGGWKATATRVETTATRDVTEGADRPTPQPLAELPAGTMLDSVIASPDGSTVLYTELIAPAPATSGAAGAPLRAQLRLMNSDGTPGMSLPSDGRHFDAMPSFTPDGGQIVFTSDRERGGLDVWTIRLGPGGGSVQQLARGGEKAALWPMIDASPSPRLFYEAFLRAAPGPAAPRSEIRMVELEGTARRGLSPGTRPRASPRADAVVFTRPDPISGKRDLYLISDKEGFGGLAFNLTNTPNVDEYDPSFSRTGGKIAYSADFSTDDENRRNYDLFVLTISDPGHPVRVTRNGSLDDSPAWDPAGKNLYFRSNRGGKWGVWKAPVP